MTNESIKAAVKAFCEEDFGFEGVCVANGKTLHAAVTQVRATPCVLKKKLAVLAQRWRLSYIAMGGRSNHASMAK